MICKISLDVRNVCMNKKHSFTKWTRPIRLAYAVPAAVECYGPKEEGRVRGQTDLRIIEVGYRDVAHLKEDYV